MRIKNITLYSHDLNSQRSFYKEILGFDICKESSDSFSIQVGWSVLTFKRSSYKYLYHYCFLIPSNKLDDAFEWFGHRLNTIEVNQQHKFDFKNWNARSFYFYDGNGNVAECIVRYDLDNQSTGEFSISDMLCVNEIGTPTSDISGINRILESNMGSKFWKGDKIRFGTNGDQYGLFLLVNNELKDRWFPTDVPTQISPFEATIETPTGLYNLAYSDQRIEFQ